MLEFFYAIRITGDSQASATVVSRRLVPFGFESLIELGAELSHEQMRGIEAVVGAKSSSMPGGARCELVLFNQHHIMPTLLDQLVKYATTVDSAADDGDPGVNSHTRSSTVTVALSG